jgi:undecaprenyl-diphosphatase
VPLIALLTVVFFVLSFLVLDADLGPTFADVQLTLAVQLLPYMPVGAILEIVSLPGFSPQNIIIVGAVVLFMFWRRWIVEAVFTAIASVGGLVTGVIKELIDRPRPTAELVQVNEALYNPSNPSFPSGHVTEYVVLYGFLFYLTYTLIPRRSQLRLPLLILFALLILLVGPSRVYMGQHWSSDALAGYAIGFAYLLVTIELYRAWQRRHPKVSPESKVPSPKSP